MDDLLNLTIHGIFAEFADNTTVIWRGICLQDLVCQISEDLAEVKTWGDANGLQLNFNNGTWL